MSIDKQLHINRLSLPQDVLHEVKTFCFYDSITGSTRIKKEHVLHSIKHADSWLYVDTDLPVPNYPNYFFGESNCDGRDLNYKIQLQIEFCIDCGNYDTFSYVDAEFLYPENIKCNCGYLN